MKEGTGLPAEDLEILKVAEILWKGAVWRAAYGRLSIRELLTILKGFGSIETIQFEKSGCFRGEISLSFVSDGVKDVTLYNLEVLGPRGQGQGRAALVFLKSVFRGAIHVEDAEIFDVDGTRSKTQAFWSKMIEEGLVDSVNNELFGVNDLPGYDGR